MSKPCYPTRFESETADISDYFDDDDSDITVEALQALGYFRDRSADEVQNLIDTIKTFTEIVFAVHAREQEDLQDLAASQNVL